MADIEGQARRIREARDKKCKVRVSKEDQDEEEEVCESSP